MDTPLRRWVTILNFRFQIWYEVETYTKHDPWKVTAINDVIKVIAINDLFNVMAINDNITSLQLITSSTWLQLMTFSTWLQLMTSSTWLQLMTSSTLLHDYSIRYKEIYKVSKHKKLLYHFVSQGTYRRKFQWSYLSISYS